MLQTQLHVEADAVDRNWTAVAIVGEIGIALHVKRIRDSQRPPEKRSLLRPRRTGGLGLRAGWQVYRRKSPTTASVPFLRCVSDYCKAYPVNHRDKSVTTMKERSIHLERLPGAVLLPDFSPQRI